MATKKVTTIANEVDRQAAKALLSDFLKATFEDFPARLPAEQQAQERESVATLFTKPTLRAAFVEFYIRQTYGKPTRKPGKSKSKTAQAIGAEVQS